MSVPMVSTPCAICKSYGNATERYAGSMQGENLDADAYSARRFYNEKIHFRMATCNDCGLLRSDPVISNQALANLYEESHFTYADQTKNLQSTYGRYLSKLDSVVPAKGKLLEIGCGNGFFLEEALRRGYDQVWGVEPSTEAIAAAASDVQPFIKKGMFSRSLFEDNTFDVIVVFQTLDHISDPAGFVADCRALLKPGGVFMAFNHNLNATSSRLMGERSPIIDIEHTYLYTPSTIMHLFKNAGLSPVFAKPAWNTLSLGYLLTLLPLRPVSFKDALVKIASKIKVEDLPMRLPLGNLWAVGKKVL